MPVARKSLVLGLTWLWAAVAVFPQEGRDRLALPQLVSGPDFATEIVFQNHGSAQVEAELLFFSATGEPAVREVEGRPRADSLPVVLPPKGTLKLAIQPTPVLEVGYALVRLTAGSFDGLAVNVVFSFGGTVVSVPGVALSRSFLAVVDETELASSAVAVTNPNSAPLLVELGLLDDKGTPVGSAEWELAPGRQEARFLSEIFDAVPDRPFLGSLEASAEAEFAMLSLRQDVEGALAHLGLRSGQTEAASGPKRFDGQAALDLVAAQMEIGARPTGSPGATQTADWISTRLGALGWAVADDFHTLVLDNVYVSVRNVVARLGSGGPAFVIGAHYDTRILADRDPDVGQRNEPVPGANDGGSGVAVLLELARVIAEHYVPQREIRLVFFDAEDNGGIVPWGQSGLPHGGWILGSTLYVESLDPASIDAVVVVDMVGDQNQRFPIERNSLESAPGLVDELWTIAAELGFETQFARITGSRILDDHVSFIERGIPAVDIIDLDYPFWHTTADTLDKVNAASLERVGRVLQQFLEFRELVLPK